MEYSQTRNFSPDTPKTDLFQSPNRIPFGEVQKRLFGINPAIVVEISAINTVKILPELFLRSIKASDVNMTIRMILFL
jgi:hypothetical protein